MRKGRQYLAATLIVAMVTGMMTVPSVADEYTGGGIKTDRNIRQ